MQESYDAYVFSNIRFARPPIGDLRFGPPQPPLVDRSKIHDGSEGFICHAAWASNPGLPPMYDTPQSEDCLFLDVIVPRSVLSGDVGKVPVLFWFANRPPRMQRDALANIVFGTGSSAAHTRWDPKTRWATQSRS